MNVQRDPDAILAAWLEEGPNALPEPTRRAIAVNTRTMNQRRHLMWMPQRSPTMNPFARIAAAAIVVIAVLGGAVYLLAPGSGVGGGPPASTAPSATPAPSAVPSASPAASAALGPIDTAGWKTYASTRYAFSIAHPADWTVTPSDRVWAFPADTKCCPPPGTETFHSPTDDVGVSVWSVALTPGTSADAWIQAYCQVMEPDTYPPCAAPQTRKVAASMDGHAGSLIQFSGDTEAFIVVGDRMYVVACWRSEFDPSVTPYGGAKRLVEGYLSTMRLLPGVPASPTSSATPRPS